ncbi:hypothetical protein BDR22DRAFT_823268 [Usnea florida]
MDESPGKMYALATALSILAIVAVNLRFYARRIKKISTIGTGICIALLSSHMELMCLPISEIWNSLDNAPGSCIDTSMMYLAQAWSDVFIDVVILSMPFPWMWKLQMAPIRKFFVFLIFQLGALVVIAGIVKLVVFYKIIYDTAAGDEDLTCMYFDPPTDLDLAYYEKDILTPTVYWPMVESSLGVVGACLPLLRPLFTDTSVRKFSSNLRAMLSFSSIRSHHNSAPSQEFHMLEAGNSRAYNHQHWEDSVGSKTYIAVTEAVGKN